MYYTENKDTKWITFGGDFGMGKTSMFIYHITGKPAPEHLIPTKVDYQHGECTINGKTVPVVYNDHEGGGEDWHRLRHFGYINVDTVVLCFSIGSPDSFVRMKEFWYPFTQEHCPKAKLLLVGLKKDLRDDKDVIKKLSEDKEKPITYKEGKELSKEINAECYLECSSVSGEGIEEVFRKATEITSSLSINHDQKKRRKKTCHIM